MKGRVDHIKVVVNRIDQNLRVADACLTIHEASNREGFLQKLDGTFEGNALSVVRDQMIFSGILALLRVWDPANDALSIPVAVKALQDDSLFARFIEIEQKRTLGRPAHVMGTAPESLVEDLKRHAKRRAEEKASRIAREYPSLRVDLVRRYAIVTKQEIVERLQNTRDKVIAHSLLESRADIRRKKEGFAAIGPAKHGDYMDLLDTTKDFVPRLTLLVTGTDSDYRDHNEIWNYYAELFWSRLGNGKPGDDISTPRFEE